MKSKFRMCLIGGTAIATCGLAGLVWAQQPALAPPPTPPSAGAPSPSPGGLPYAIQQLPQFKGTVARYTLTPRGDVDGLLLSDGTEVHFPPHISAQLVYAIKPGDAITRYPWSTRWDAKFIESSFTEGKGTSDTSELLGPPPNRQTA